MFKFQSYMNKTKFHINIDQLDLSGFLLLAAFPEPSDGLGNLYVWSGALMELWSAWG